MKDLWSSCLISLERATATNTISMNRYWCEYTKIEPTDNGNLKTEKNGLVGLHDQNGIELIPNEYTSIQPLKDTPHIYFVEKNKKYGIRYLGRDAENIPCKYDGLTLLSKINAFNAKENRVGQSNSQLRFRAIHAGQRPPHRHRHLVSRQSYGRRPWRIYFGRTEII